MTDLQKLKKTYDELGIRYHEVVEDGYTYIDKMSAHDKPGYIYVMQYGLVPLTKGIQLPKFIEFDKNGKIASW